MANRELVVLSTCSPSASPDVNWRFVRGRAIAIACPKLDRTEGYVEKLTEIFKLNGIPKVIVVRMEVPCCGGLSVMVQQAARRLWVLLIASGNYNILVGHMIRLNPLLVVRFQFIQITIKSPL